MTPGSLIVQVILSKLVNVAETLLRIILPVIYFTTRNDSVKDKVYRLFRFIFLVDFFFWLPVMGLMVWYFFILSGESESNRISFNLTTTFIYWGIELVVGVCLLLSRPEKKIPRISLESYELVAYTSRGHRFLHHVLDILFLQTYFFSLLTNFRFFARGEITAMPEIWAILVLILIYLLYYYMAEVFALQTLGKIITNSVVVSTSGPLTAGKILKRSLCRFIPFETFSFLGNGKWHDNLSHTAVVYRDTWEKVFAEETVEEENAESKAAFSQL